MTKTQLCECTINCPGRQHCEIGTWVQPDPAAALAQALTGLQPLKDWLHIEPHTTKEIVAAIFGSTPFSEDPCKVDLFSAFSRALEALGFQSVGGNAPDSTWRQIGDDPSAKESIKGPAITTLGEIAICMVSLPLSQMPFGFQRVLEFMVLMNADWLIQGGRKTSEITKAFFPAASAEVLDSWLIQALDDCLYRIGYSPIGTAEPGEAGVNDDPQWFCDGDSRDFLKHNLWRGEASASASLESRELIYPQDFGTGPSPSPRRTQF